MTTPVFVVPSVEKSPTGSLNHPINIAHCTCLHKDSFLATKLNIYSIRFEGCVDDNNQPHGWGYSTEQERDADYDRILKAFAGTTDEPEPEPKPVSGEEVLEDVINWLDDNATACVLGELRSAMLAKYGSEK